MQGHTGWVSLAACLVALVSVGSSVPIAMPPRDLLPTRTLDSFTIADANSNDNTEQQPSTRIVGGSVTTLRSYYTSLWSCSDVNCFNFCGGSLVAAQWVLSAAHCIDPSAPLSLVCVSDFDVFDDESTEECFRPSQVTSHPGYDTDTLRNDIALIKLDRSSSKTPVKVYDPSIDGSLPSTAEVVGFGLFFDLGDREGTKSCSACGISCRSDDHCRWGYDNSCESTKCYNILPSNNDRLHAVSLPIESDSQCIGVYGGDYSSTVNLCAGGLNDRDSCQGDSGGPLTIGSGSSRRQIGVVSYGFGCGFQGVPGVYARASQYIPFMKSQGVPISTGDPEQSPEQSPDGSDSGGISTTLIYVGGAVGAALFAGLILFLKQSTSGQSARQNTQLATYQSNPAQPHGLDHKL